VFETLPGWAEPVDEAESIADLPETARSYIAFVEKELEVPVALVGTGQERERVLYCEASAALFGA
jgi:adenylosuccinate synthase